MDLDTYISIDTCITVLTAPRKIKTAKYLIETKFVGKLKNEKIKKDFMNEIEKKFKKKFDDICDSFSIITEAPPKDNCANIKSYATKGFYMLDNIDEFMSILKKYEEKQKLLINIKEGRMIEVNTYEIFSHFKKQAEEKIYEIISPDISHINVLTWVDNTIAKYIHDNSIKDINEEINISYRLKDLSDDMINEYAITKYRRSNGQYCINNKFVNQFEAQRYVQANIKILEIEITRRYNK